MVTKLKRLPTESYASDKGLITNIQGAQKTKPPKSIIQ
jgi:hypothetical protein